MSKKRINIIVGRSLLLLLVAVTFVLLISAVRSKKSKTCIGVTIQIGLTQQKGFIDNKEVAFEIKEQLKQKPEGTVIRQFDLRKIEKALEENVWIKKAQLFFDNNEQLHVQVLQRIPVARIMDNTGASYYLDSTGFKLPLSNSDRADVPVFTSVPFKRSASLQRTILDIANVINSDSFWMAQAAEINWLPANKFELYPAFGSHVVDLGDGMNAADKFGRLKLFYQVVSAKKGFDAYPKLSVAFSGQVVAIKPQITAPQVDAGKAMQVFDQMVKTNRTNASIDKEENDLKKREINSVTPVEISPVSDQPPDIKNKGNPADKNSKNNPAPKAVMPRFNHN